MRLAARGESAAHTMRGAMPSGLQHAILVLLAAGCLAVGACRRAPEPAAPATPPARNLLLITVDTLRADRVGAYGHRAAHTPSIDGLAARGARFTHAYSSAPITLTSHATLMTGRYPPGHGARDNGMRMDLAVPTLADTLARAGFSTAAFVAAFPLDRRFGLIKGFNTYDDRMPRGPQGRLASERPGRAVVDPAIAWLDAHRSDRFFLWVHLFEPHAPYGDPSDRRPAAARYDDEVAEADRQIGRLLAALGGEAASTVVAVTSDHGEAFGEHGEVSHSVFVYDTTLHVPLVLAGPAIARRIVATTVGLVDLAPTLLRRLGVTPFDADGVDLTPALDGQDLPARELYAESFAPLLDFGWSPLRTLRADGFKYIAAPHPELYHVTVDAAETRNVVDADAPRAAALKDWVEKIASGALTSGAPPDPEASARLQALGYTSGGVAGAAANRPDPKDKRELAARIAQVTSGELRGPALQKALEQVLAEDPGNPQAHLRLGYVGLEAGHCPEAERHFRAAIAGRLPGADAHLGLAACQAAARHFDAAAATLQEAESIEPDNPVVVANRGVVLSDGGHPADGVPVLQRALTLDPDFDEARFNLALAYLRAGRRGDAAAEATELLRRMPGDAPQRPEVARMLASLQ